MDLQHKGNDEQLDRLLRWLFAKAAPRGDVDRAERRFIRALDECRAKRARPAVLRRRMAWAYVAAASVLATAVLVHMQRRSPDMPGSREIATTAGERTEGDSMPSVFDATPIGSQGLIALDPNQSSEAQVSADISTPLAEPALWIAGVVLDPNENAAPGLRVTCQLLGADNTSDHTTDETGHFRIDALPAGEYLVTARSPEFLGGQTLAAAGSDRLVLNLQKRGDLNVVVAGEEGEFNAGRVSGAEGESEVSRDTSATRLGRALVSLRSRSDENNRVTMNGIADENGAVVFEGLPRGRYTVTARFDWQKPDEVAATSDIDMILSKQPVTLKTSANIAATAELVRSLSDIPAGYAGMVTMACRYSRPPIGDREYVSSLVGSIFNNPQRLPYASATDEEMEAWVEKVSNPHEEEYLAVASWTPDAFGFHLISGQRPLPDLHRNEYYGFDGVRQVHWTEEGPISNFRVYDAQSSVPAVSHQRFTSVNSHILIRPLGWFADSSLQLDAEQDAAGSWILHGEPFDIGDSICCVWMKTVPSNREVLREIRFIHRDGGSYRIVETTMAGESRIGGFVFPEEVTQTTRRLRQDMNLPELKKAIDFNAHSDSRLHLRVIEAQYAPSRELFPSGSLLPEPPEDSTFTDYRQPHGFPEQVDPQIRDYRSQGSQVQPSLDRAPDR